MRDLYKFILLVMISMTVYGQDVKEEIDLTGQWCFQIGDSLAYASVTLDDSNWDLIDVPDCWENAGYPGYDGFAWYRRWVVLPKRLNNKYLILKLGRIDDNDRVYINGHYINGGGYMRQDSYSAAGVQREYAVPPVFLRFGEKNLIAVRVFDLRGCGGIADVPVGIYSHMEFSRLLVQDFSGLWKFAAGDSTHWSKPDYNDSHWTEIVVPANWEKHGYPDLDGFAWYRKHVVFDGSLSRKRLILTLGKINDMDEVFFNGVRIGRTGSFNPSELIPHGTVILHWERFYFIPPQLIRWDEKNVIAVRIYDVWRTGGIWDGPVGITTREAYLEYMESRDKQ